MENKKVQDYKNLVQEIYDFYWNKKPCLINGEKVLPEPGMGGPLNAPVMVIAINGNVPGRDIKKYLNDFNDPFLTESREPDYENLSNFNSIWMRYVIRYILVEKGIGELDIKKELGEPLEKQFEAMKLFQTSKEDKDYYDNMGPALRDLFQKVDSKFDKPTMEKIVRSGIFYANAVKKPTKRANELTPDDWNDEKGFLEKEIRLIEPKIILCMGKTAFHLRKNHYFEWMKPEVQNLNFPWPELSVYKINDQIGQMVFMNHFSWGWFFKNNHHENFKIIARKINLLSELNEFFRKGDFLLS